MIIRPSILFSVGLVAILISVGNILERSPHVVTSDDDNPRASRGSNTIQFQINQEEKYSADGVQADIINSGDVLIISMWFGDSFQDHMSFIVENKVKKESVYMLNKPQVQYSNIRLHHDHCQYTSEELYSGVLMINYFDPATKTIGGSFELLASAAECDQVIRITDGVFDIKIPEGMLL